MQSKFETFAFHLGLFKREELKQNPDFAMFQGWGKEYGALSCSVRDKEGIINYIISQWEHHRVKSFEEEYRKMIDSAGLEWNDYRLT